MLISSPNTLPPRIMFEQISGHLMAQSSWHKIKHKTFHHILYAHNFLLCMQYHNILLLTHCSGWSLHLEPFLLIHPTVKSRYELYFLPTLTCVLSHLSSSEDSVVPFSVCQTPIPLSLKYCPSSQLWSPPWKSQATVIAITLGISSIQY